MRRTGCDDQRFAGGLGHALAQARGKAAKHAVKRVDRLLSNQGIDVWVMFPLWIKELVGERRKLVIAMDWIDFDADDQATLVFSLISNEGMHEAGRSSASSDPLRWPLW